MLDDQATRGIRQGAHAAGALAAALLALALACAGPARAQLGVVPPAGPAAPGADSPTLGGDSAHRNAWAGAGLRPPLEVAWQTAASPVYAAIAVGPRVIVQTATALTAVTTDAGKPIWSVPLTGGAVEVATEGGRVYLTSATGVAALDITTGAVRWSSGDAGATGPVVADGRLYTGNAAGEVVARQASTGNVLWRAGVGIAGTRPAVAGARVYVTGTCSAASIDVLLGLEAWRTGCERDTGTRTLLAGTTVLAENGALYANTDGRLISPIGGAGTIGAGLLFASPIRDAPASLFAADAGSFAPRWAWTPPLPGRMLLRPAIVDDAVWQVVDAGAEGLVLAALDASTGAERWTGFLPGDGSFEPAVGSAVAVSPGLLLVPTANGGLAALRNAPAGPLGVRATLPRNVVATGEQTTITGEVLSNGHGLVGPRAVFLQADEHPFDGAYRTLGAVQSGRGGFTLDTKVRRNTQYRLASDGVIYPPTVVYAQPSIAVKYKATRVERVVRATLRIGAERGFRRAGRVGIYRLKDGDDVLVRIGRGRSKGNGVARFKVRIPADLSRTDRVLPCLRGGSKRGFGAPNVLDRYCGARAIAVPAQASAAAGLILSEGTGSAMPLKRLSPAAEKE